MRRGPLAAHPSASPLSSISSSQDRAGQDGAAHAACVQPRSIAPRQDKPPPPGVSLQVLFSSCRRVRGQRRTRVAAEGAPAVGCVCGNPLWHLPPPRVSSRPRPLGPLVCVARLHWPILGELHSPLTAQAALRGSAREDRRGSLFAPQKHGAEQGAGHWLTWSWGAAGTGWGMGAKESSRHLSPADPGKETKSLAWSIAMCRQWGEGMLPHRQRAVKTSCSRSSPGGGGGVLLSASFLCVWGRRGTIQGAGQDPPASQ